MPRKPHELFDTPEQKADLEARDGLLQFEAVQKMVAASSAGFTFTPATLLELHRLAIADIYTCAGTFRTGGVVLLRGGTVDYAQHQPPDWQKVVPYVEEMCDYVNRNFTKSAIHLASYVMWRHNWIHPFFGGNGRVSRAASYFVLCARLGFYLPGTNTIPNQIEQTQIHTMTR